MERNLEIVEQAIAAGVQSLGPVERRLVRAASHLVRRPPVLGLAMERKTLSSYTERIKKLRARGIRFLAYNNPYLCSDGPLFKEAAEQGVH